MRDHYLRQIFIKCVAAILGSQEIRIDKATFEYLVLLVELRMQQTFSDLAQIIKIQRHTEPSIDDLMLWITRNNIDIVQTQHVTGKQVDQLNNLQFEFDVEDISPEQAVFFDPQLFQIKKIVKSNDKVPFYVPEWSPALPPDHTYMATADYSNRVRGLQELHEKLFDEGHQAELALQRLLGSKGSDSTINLQFPNASHEPKQQSLPEPQQSKQPEQPPESQVEKPNASILEDVPMEDETIQSGSGSPNQNGAEIPENPTDPQEPQQPENPTASQEPQEPQDSGPTPYITIVNSEPAPEPAEKPLSLKLNFGARKPKKPKASQRPKLDIVQMAQNQATEQNQKDQDNETQETNLKALLEQAIASVDA